MKMSRICPAGALWQVEVFLQVKESPMHTHECVWRSGGVITSAWDGGQWSAARSGPLYPWNKRTPHVHRSRI